MEYEVSKIEAAIDQLDWSIRLFLDYQAYIPAITLAGAAEEVIGGALSETSALTVLKRELSAEHGLSGKVVSQLHLNKTKNWLKHWDGLRDNETVWIELETEAVQYIVRALANLVQHDRSLPSEGPRFIAWLNTTWKPARAA
jgi:hypothetical protein